MSNIQDKVDEHEKRIHAMEINSARLDERLDALVKSTDNLKKSTWGFSLIMLLTLIYLVLGPKGYKDVTSTILPTPPPIQQTSQTN